MTLLHNGPSSFPTGEDKTRFVFCNRIITWPGGGREFPEVVKSQRIRLCTNDRCFD